MLLLGTITITAGNIYGGSDVTAERDKAIGATIRPYRRNTSSLYGDWTITGVSMNLVVITHIL